MHAQTTADRDRGPRLLLPEDVPYSLAGNNSRLIAALIACFLMVNTGIFFLAHQASSNVNESLSQATGLIADAISLRGQGEAPLHAAQPSQFGPGVTHEVELPPQGFAAAVRDHAAVGGDLRGAHRAHGALVLGEFPAALHVQNLQ